MRRLLAWGMRTRLRHYWDILTTGYWFVPTLMMAGAAGLAMLLIYLDGRFASEPGRSGWLYAGGADGALTLLSVVAGSLITVAGVVFSITIAALTQASSQFGPRLLRNFMRDVGNQVVLGTFVATFVYCLLVLRTVHGETREGGEFVPQASVTVAVLMATASIVVLIYFIHHVSVSLQPPAVVAAVRDDLERVIARIPDEQEGTCVALAPGPTSASPSALPADGGNGMPPNFDADAAAVPADVEGYVQAVDYSGLMRAAAEADVVVRLMYRPGDYVILGTCLAHVWPAARCGPELRERLNEAHLVGRHGTAEQDVEFALKQMVEVAVRALSPAINDPFTAIHCLDALGSAVCRIARRGLPGPMRYDDGGRLRIVTPVTTFSGVVDTSFNQIRQYGRDSVAVTVRLLEVLGACAGQLSSDDQRRSIRRHAEAVYRQGEAVIREPHDLAELRQRWGALQRVLGNAGPGTAGPATAAPEPAGPGQAMPRAAAVDAVTARQWGGPR